ncbi:uncharacterized protein G2W53_032732 [Senna tora]|uniref:Uncharacterized protein n=1 Tax=Senna tora TaxID=362788 RepID=A0A834SZQ4_9FABA|nr:uncharacterized protein G2W53_032732 [Senna tora]
MLENNPSITSEELEEPILFLHFSAVVLGLFNPDIVGFGNFNLRVKRDGFEEKITSDLLKPAQLEAVLKPEEAHHQRWITCKPQMRTDQLIILQKGFGYLLETIDDIITRASSLPLARSRGCFTLRLCHFIRRKPTVSTLSASGSIPHFVLQIDKIPGIAHIVTTYQVVQQAITIMLWIFTGTLSGFLNDDLLSTHSSGIFDLCTVQETLLHCCSLRQPGFSPAGTLKPRGLFKALFNTLPSAADPSQPDSTSCEQTPMHSGNSTPNIGVIINSYYRNGKSNQPWTKK